MTESGLIAAKRGRFHHAWARELVTLLPALALWFLTCVIASSITRARTVDVGSSEELNELLRDAKGGETFLLAPIAGAYYIVAGEDVDPASPVTIASNDPANKAKIGTANLQRARNLVFDGLVFDSDLAPKGRESGPADLNIAESENITVQNCVMKGTATAYLTEAAKSSAARDFALVQNSRGISFIGNNLSSYFHGIGMLETSDVRIERNDISAMQGDGIHMGGISGLIISKNHLHDFLGSDQSVNHSDMIQLWSANTTMVSRNVQITGNIMLSGDGAGSETIFMRNEQADSDPLKGEERFYENFLISDNLIQNGHLHGITIGEIRGLVIRNNTLVLNPLSLMGDGDKRVTYPPAIFVAERSHDVEVSNNVAAAVTAPPTAILQDNLVIVQGRPQEDNATEKLFLGAAGGGRVPVSAFRVVAGSLADRPGLGAPITHATGTKMAIDPVFMWGEASKNPGAYTFDASLTAGPEDVSDAAFQWDMGDGTTLAGKKIEHRFTGPGHWKVTLTVTDKSARAESYWTYVDVPEPLLLKLDEEGGMLADTSSYKSVIVREENPSPLVDGIGGRAIRLTSKRALSTDPASRQIFGLARFGLGFFMKRDAGGIGDYILAGIHTSISLTASTRGDLRFELIDSQGLSATALTGPTKINDGAWHHIAINYDSGAGTIEIYVDGALTGKSRAMGRMQGAKFWGLSFGSLWNDSFSGLVSGIEMRREPFSPERIRALANLLPGAI